MQPVQFALNNINTVVDALADKFPGMEMEFYLSGKDNFRKELATIQPYKGNRSEFDRPVHYDALREFLVKKYNAEIVNGQEADDAIGIRATELGDQAVIVSIDKDLDTIKGWHYNWVKGDMYYVEEKEADKNFYMQLLTGDSTDNIPGIEGIGTKKAEKILKGLSKPKGMYQAVLAAYAEAYPDGYKGHSIKKAINEIGNLLYIRKHPDEKWSSP